MKIFIDLGAFDGDTIAQAMRVARADKYFGFEPYILSFNEAKKRFKDHTNVKLFQAAAATVDGQAFFYIHKKDMYEGNSMFKNKPNVNPSAPIRVETIDIAKFISSNCFKDDEITLKVDVEGKEYDIFEHLIATGVIQYISKIYCEWHYKKVGISEERHNAVLTQLQGLGFALTGSNTKDEFIYAK